MQPLPVLLSILHITVGVLGDLVYFNSTLDDKHVTVSNTACAAAPTFAGETHTWNNLPSTYSFAAGPLTNVSQCGMCLYLTYTRPNGFVQGAYGLLVDASSSGVLEISKRWGSDLTGVNNPIAPIEVTIVTGPYLCKAQPIGENTRWSSGKIKRRQTTMKKIITKQKQKGRRKNFFKKRSGVTKRF